MHLILLALSKEEKETLGISQKIKSKVINSHTFGNPIFQKVPGCFAAWSKTRPDFK
jgi:hypothetical protein